jgi:hypothetical protein
MIKKVKVKQLEDRELCKIRKEMEKELKNDCMILWFRIQEADFG